MLPDYPSIKKKVDILLMRYLKEEIFRRSPILKEIRQTVQHEGRKGTYGDVDGRENPIEYKKVAAGFSLTRDEMRQPNFQVVLSKFDEVAETFAAGQSKTLFATVSEAAESVGNVVDAKGKLTKEAFLELMRKMQCDFNPHSGEPQRPAMVLHPDTLAKIGDDLKSWKQDPEFMAALSAIEQQQRLDWRDRESSRRLAD
ncbi:MAG: hypothetical protein OXH08_13735 [Gammaproteobacteria bacterium]|nr:hypothetical protein [Gammaproteobacteria bacterium]